MKLVLLYILMFVFSGFSFSQVGMGEWRMHISPFVGNQVVTANNAAYLALENGVLEYDYEFNEKTVWTAANFLSDVNVSSIGYEPNSNIVAVGYANGNLDLIIGQSVFNIPAIVLANISGLKTINKIRSYDGELYLATGFGVVVINVENREVRDTYFPTTSNSPVNDVAFLNDTIYALTSGAVYSAPANNNFLGDPSQWNNLNSVPNYDTLGEYRSIVEYQNNLFISYNDDIYNSDTLFMLENNSFSAFLDEIEIDKLNITSDLLVVPVEGSTILFNSELEEEFRVFSYENEAFPVPNDLAEGGDYYFIADKRSGLIKVNKNNQFDNSIINFPGPRFSSAFQAKWVRGKLAVASGGLAGLNPSFSSNGGMLLENEEWKSWYPSNQEIIKDAEIWDFISTAVNPRNTEEVAFGTYSKLPLVVSKNGVEITDTFGYSNSLLEPNSEAVGFGFVSDLIYENDHLWVLNGLTSEPLKVLTDEGEWYSFNFGAQASDRRTTEIVVDQNGTKWFGVNGVGVVAFNDNGTPEDPSDDEFRILNTGQNSGNLPSSNVNALAVDLDNNLWAGTEEGMRVLYNTSNVFDASPGDYNFQRLLIEFGENVEIVLGSSNVTAISIDGANRKWIGTANAGVFLFTPDGLTLLESFRTSDSPLLSNNILDIAIDQENGEVYFVTSDGMISYRSDASEGDPNYRNVKVFPNPVYPDYFGPITIQGIAANSDVKITDIAGKMVYQTSSNGGTATWDGKTLDGNRATTGVYLIWTTVDVEGGKGREVGKVVFIN